MINTKNKLIERISSIQNPDTLEFLSDLFDEILDDGTFELPEQMKKDIDLSISQIKKGEYEMHESVMKKFLNE